RRAGARALLAEARGAALREGLAENVAEDVARVETGRAELEMRAARSALLLLTPEPRERVAARAGAELLEARLAGGVDLAAVESLALFGVADDLVGLVGFGKALLGLRI